MLCTSMLEQSIDLCSACSSKGTTVLALLERNRVAKIPEYPRGPLFECAPAAKTLSHAQVTLFEHARDARTRSVTPIHRALVQNPTLDVFEHAPLMYNTSKQ